MTVLAALLVLGVALAAVGSFGPVDPAMALGLQILGGLVGVPALVAALLVLPALVHGWRNQPAREIGWWPVGPDEPTTFAFAAQSARYHGLWLCLDVHYEFSRGPHYVRSTIEVTADGELVFAGNVATCWGFPGDSTGATRLFVGGKLARRLGVPLSVLELDRIVEARPTGRFRARSLLLRLADLEPGQRVEISLTLEPPARGLELRAHALVALPG